MPSHQQAPEHLAEALASHEDRIAPPSPTNTTTGTTNRRTITASNASIKPKRAHTAAAASTINNTPASGTNPFGLPLRARTTSLTIIEPINFPPRPSARSSPLLSRAPSFAISEQQRPRTGSSTTTGHVSLDNDDDDGLTPQTSPEEGPDTTTPIWTPALADRLTFVQRQKWESQKRWSAGQETWAKEEEHLLETRRVHLKAIKKIAADQTRAEKSVEKAVAVWKRKTFLGKTWPGRGRGKKGGVGSGDEDGDSDESRERIGSGSLEDDEDAEDAAVEAVAGLDAAAQGGNAKHPVLQSPPRQRMGLKGLIRRMSGTNAKDKGDYE